MDLDRVVEYLRFHASPVELAAFHHILSHQPAPRAAIDAVAVGQRPDGGWAPFWAPDYSSLDATCYRLARLHLLGPQAAEPALCRAADFFLARQRPDGSWEEDASIADFAPPWAAPGDLAARLYLTANVAVSFPSPLDGRQGEGMQAAAAFLLSHLTPAGSFPSFLQTHWLAAALFLRLGYDEPAERLLAYLHTRMADLPAANLAWMLVALLDAGASPDHPLIVAAGERLDGLQTPAGNWPDDEGMGNEVHLTLTSLYALGLCQRR